MKKIFLNLSIAAGLLLIAASSLKAGDDKILIIINSGVYDSINSYLETYKNTLETQGYEVIKKKWINKTAANNGNGNTAADIKAYIKGEEENLKGVILIGDLPFAQFKKDSETFLADLFYMDLDGSWTLSNKYYTAHSGNTAPEIWVGRLNAKTLTGKSEVNFLKSYFNRNSSYRSKGLASNGRGLFYSDKTSNLSKLFGAKIDTTYTDNYKKNYGWTHFSGSASNYKTVTFNKGESASSAHAKESQSLFYNLIDIPKIGNFNKGNHLAGHYLFSNNYCLAALANSAPTGASFSSDLMLYSKLSNGNTGTTTLGDAFLEWFKENLTTPNYGLVILGDPTLTMEEILNDSSADSKPTAATDTASSAATTAVPDSTTAVSDTAAPSGSISINSGTSAYTKSTSVTLTLSATDSMGVTGYYLSTGSTAPSASASGWTTIDSTISYSGSVSRNLSAGDGLKIIYVWYKDAIGNISEIASDSISFDLTAPSLTITSPTTASVFNTKEASLTLSGTASDNASGIEKITYASAQGATGTAIGTTNWSIPSLKLSKGENLFTITAYDKLNNSVQASFTANCEVIAPPETPIFNQKYEGKAVNSDSLSWSWGPAESGGPVEEYWVSPSWLPTGFLTTVTSYVPTRKLTKGIYQLKLSAKNSAGVSKVTIDTVIIVDSDESNSTETTANEKYDDSSAYSYSQNTDASSNESEESSEDDLNKSLNSVYSDINSEDTSAPSGSITINNDAKYTNSSDITLSLLAYDNMGVSGYYISESSSTPQDSDDYDWNKLTDKMAYWIDLEKPYVTLDNNYIESVWWSLKELHKK